MTEKNIKSRIVHKHDIEAHWNLATNFVPLQGEIIIYDIDENYNYERFKIGDGKTNVNELPFANDGLATEEALTALQAEMSRKVSRITVVTNVGEKVSTIFNAMSEAGIAGGDSCFVILNGYHTKNLFISFSWKGSERYSIKCVDMDTLTVSRKVIEGLSTTSIDSILPNATSDSPMVSVTYDKLKELRDSYSLTPGTFYRITDYECTTVQSNTRAESNPFDIIVQAISSNTLSEVATAAYNESNQYFADSNISTWELRYCLDNDTSRFAWALDGQAITNINTSASDGNALIRLPDFDGQNETATENGYTYAWGSKDESSWCDASGLVFSQNPTILEFGETVWNANIGEPMEATVVRGKGVIYYLKDENGNECPYDFKNITYRISLSGLDYDTYYPTFITKSAFSYTQWGGEWSVSRETYHADQTIDGVKYYCYRCSDTPHAWSSNLFYITDEELTTDSVKYSITDGVISEINYGGSLIEVRYGNNIVEPYMPNDVYALPWVIFIGLGKGNVVHSSSQITFSNTCKYNTIGANCFGLNFDTATSHTIQGGTKLQDYRGEGVSDTGSVIYVASVSYNTYGSDTIEDLGNFLASSNLLDQVIVLKFNYDLWGRYIGTVNGSDGWYSFEFDQMGENNHYEGNVSGDTKLNVIFRDSDEFRTNLVEKLDYAVNGKEGEFTEYSQGLDYTEVTNNGPSYVVSGLGSCADTEIIIPTNYNGLRVTEIATNAFNGSNVTKVVIPRSVTTIQPEAFINCQELQEVYIPSTVETISTTAFVNCSQIRLCCESSDPLDGWEGAWDGTWDNYSVEYGATMPTLKIVGLKEKIENLSNLGGGNTSIAGLATETYVDTKVAGIVNSAPETLDTLNELAAALGNDKNFATTVSTQIGNKVDKTTTVNGHALSGNVTVTKSDVGLGSVVNTGDSATPVSGGTTKFTTGGAYTELAKKVDKVDGKGLSTNDYTSEDKAKLDYLYGKPSEGLAYTLSDDGASYIVTGIGTCTDTDIKIPPLYNGLPVTSIGDFAFRYCSSLESVVIPDSVTSIGQHAFAYCDSLESVVIGDSVTSIGGGAFLGCTSLTSIVIPDSVTTIDNGAFNGCESLTNVVIGDSVASIGGYAFHKCLSLTNVVIPDSVTSIGVRAFYNCYNLTIYCETTEQPSGWSSGWNPNNRPVIWGTALDFIDVNDQLNDVNNQLNDVYNQLNDVNAKTANMIPVTYFELKSLRDNSELIPGMFYRITDYICTTSQENTRAMENKFDIIVQALSANTLSETASADYHIEAASVGAGYTFKPEVLADEDGALVEGSVTKYYDIYEDCDTDANGVVDYKSTDIFIGYDYLENNEGVTVPVLYKTDPDVEPEADYSDVFYYVGTYELDGVVYDKWRKIESEHYTWDSTGKIYALTNVIVDGNTIDTSITPDVANIPAWELKYCLDNDTSRFAWAQDNYEQKIINLESGFSNGQPLTRQPSADAQDSEDYQYAWGTQADVDDGDSSNFWYSQNEEIVNGETLYYCGEYAEAELAGGGKGVIYYMKDEHGNECPYDFKNIQFKRMVSLKTGAPQLDEENGVETWVYTFCGTSYHIDNDEWSKLKDGSLESPYGHQNDEGGSTFHHNVMGEYILFYDQENEDYSICGKQYLNNNVFFGNWQEIGSTSPDDCPYYFAQCCYNNKLGLNCYDNTFNDGCYGNTFISVCSRNTFMNTVCNNYFAFDCFASKINGSRNFVARSLHNKTLDKSNSFITDEV